ncbi:DUF1684 domain-containing protein [uncultured Pseudokineococcus sp.]|uniref:DUF1684 domain-containing protein n=1 Tax=uncultured Pseudokineococcus sp. TaxID=1642928 RepID=UPI00261AE947|nr:DUF1684 domain-containing protein [uncultured Pseudokineococcus sp.]
MTTTSTDSPAASSRLDVLDWRRRVERLYAAVREEAVRDPGAAHATWRRGRDELLGGHPASPLLPEHREGFAGLPVAPYDPAHRHEVEVTPWTAGPDADGGSFSYRTGTDGVVSFERAGTAELPGVGSLALWWLVGYGGGLFVPVRDGGSGRASYGGGRYVLDTVKGADLGSVGERLVLDLNFAYPPSCAYDPEWACPLPPAENRVDAVLEVGELHEGPWAEH